MPTEPSEPAVRSIPHGEAWGGCRLCQHLRTDLTCLAFPDRIPLAIFSGEIDHLVRRPRQIGDALFEALEQPTPWQRRVMDRAAARGEGWAVAALAKIEAAVAPR